jgi:hypothetical protein
MIKQKSLLILTLLTTVCCAQGQRANKKDTIRKAPQFSFSQTLEKQETELAANPMLKRFARIAPGVAQAPALSDLSFFQPGKPA